MHHKLLSDTFTFEIAKVEQKRQSEEMAGLGRKKDEGEKYKMRKWTYSAIV